MDTLLYVLLARKSREDDDRSIVNLAKAEDRYTSAKCCGSVCLMKIGKGIENSIVVRNAVTNTIRNARRHAVTGHPEMGYQNKSPQRVFKIGEW